MKTATDCPLFRFPGHKADTLLADQLLKAKALEIALGKTSEPGPTAGGCHPGALQGLPGEQEQVQRDPSPRPGERRQGLSTGLPQQATRVYPRLVRGLRSGLHPEGRSKRMGLPSSSVVTTSPNLSPAPSKTGWLKTRSSPSTSIPVAHGRTGMPGASTVVSASSVSIENYPTA